MPAPEPPDPAPAQAPGVGRNARVARLLHVIIFDYGMVLVLAALVAVFSVMTLTRQPPEGTAGGRLLAEQVPAGARVAAAGKDTDADRRLTAALAERLASGRAELVLVVHGTNAEIRAALEEAQGEFDTIAAAPSVARQPVFDRFVGGGKRLLAPGERLVCVFLDPDNLSNVASRITVVAIVAIGMTMVIITAGIDLSVGSLLALAAVVTCWCIDVPGGGKDGAGVVVMVLAALAGVVACALAGAFTGTVVTGFCVPPFIATLAMMLMVRGVAFKITDDETINDVPAGFDWLGAGTLLGVPNSVLLMAVLYLGAHVVMRHTRLGRYIYAVGGNPEAARLSGVPVKRVKMVAYVTCGALAGVGGVILASRFKSGAANFGMSYELEVIAAVVVGGTSLFGGKGNVFGTLVGAFIIGVIQNGMNLIGLSSQDQLIALGAVILVAVILERISSGEWRSATGG